MMVNKTKNLEFNDEFNKGLFCLTALNWAEVHPCTGTEALHRLYSP